jgi:hypothetical protein
MYGTKPVLERMEAWGFAGMDHPASSQDFRADCHVDRVADYLIGGFIADPLVTYH